MPIISPLRPSPWSYLGDDARRQAVAVLDQLGIDLQALQLGVTRAHHNVRSCDAVANHKLLDDVYHDLVDQADKVTEMVEALGAESSGSVEELAQGTRLRPWPKGILTFPVLGYLVCNRIDQVMGFCGDAIEALESVKAHTLANEVMNVQQALAVWSWKVGAGLPTSSEVTERVYAQLEEDFPSEALAWVRSDPMGAAQAASQAARASRFGTDASEITTDADGTLRV